MSITYHNIESIFTHEPVEGVELAYHYGARVAHEYERGSYNKQMAGCPSDYYGIDEVEFCDATISKMEIFVEGELINTLTVAPGESFALESHVYEALTEHAEEQYRESIA
ncbi:MAG: hypothetical protein R3301_19440 [Saprospiraceae bacterium]|nr:hypothetical protein [Saprospiraceae bacterium]